MTSESSYIPKTLRTKITFVTCFRTSLLVCLLACFYIIWFDYWNIARLIEYQKCPACYGESLCPALLNDPNLLKVEYLGWFGWITNSITTKNVYRGSLDSVDVMIKRLGQESELKEMDEKLCKKVPQFCQNEVDLSDDLYDIILKDLRNILSNRIATEHEVNLMRLCPSSENLDSLFKIFNGPEDNTSTMPLSKLVNLWTILHINGEPLVLQMFPKEEGWPFPQYLGTCGRIIVETFEGSPLREFYDESWHQRARLSLQLLDAVDKFTLRSPDYALYLLDYSPDNIVVDADHTISFVDLEHTIIVDKHSSLFDKQNSFHQSSTFCKEGDCSYYSLDDICGHQTSDFNHYMLCKEILAPSEDPFVTRPEGLLHSTPLSIHKKYPLFESALKNCSSDRTINHMVPAQILRDVLQEIGHQ